MPSNTSATTNYGENDICCLATETGLRSPRGITIDPATIKKNSQGNCFVESGSIVLRLSSGLGRIYPASRATAATATSSPTVVVKNIQGFAVGDVVAINGTTAVGSIASINADTSTLTLAANAANAVAIGDRITVASPTGTPIGIVISPNHNLAKNNDVPCYTSASVYSARMPWWSSTIQAIFPEITLVP